MSNALPDSLDKGKSPLVVMRQRMAEYFTDDELETLCFDLGIDFDELGKGNKTNKIIKLIGWAKRHQQLSALRAAILEARPSLVLPSLEELQTDPSLSFSTPPVLITVPHGRTLNWKNPRMMVLVSTLFVIALFMLSGLGKAVFNRLQPLEPTITPSSSSIHTAIVVTTATTSSVLTQPAIQNPTANFTPTGTPTLTPTPTPSSTSTPTSSPSSTPTEVPLPIACNSRAIIPTIFSQSQNSSDKNLFYGPESDPNFLCQGVYDTVHSPPLAVHLQFQYGDANFGFWGLAFSQGLDATAYSEVCFWVYTDSVSQILWFQLRDLQQTVGAVDVVVDQAGQWQEKCIPLTLFSNNNVRLNQLDNFTVWFDEQSSSSTVWVDDFDFR